MVALVPNLGMRALPGLIDCCCFTRRIFFVRKDVGKKGVVGVLMSSGYHTAWRQTECEYRGMFGDIYTFGNDLFCVTYPVPDM